MSELQFDTAEIPAVTVNRTAAPNPFDGKFPSDDKALVVTVKGTEKERETEAATLVAQARKAAEKVDRTARKKIEEVTEGTGKNAAKVTKVILWTVPRITRPRTPKDGAGNTASE